MPQKPNVYPVIMCGGYGTRLWPASRPSRPKQFIDLIGSESLFLQTLKRVSDLEGVKKLVVVAGTAHANWIAKDLAGLDKDTLVLLEPEGRDSAPAIAAAIAHIEQIDPEGVAVVVASDHHVTDAALFVSDISTAVNSAREGGIVTLGIEPTGPSSAYGYIRPGSGSGPVKPVESFVEKPDEETAARYISEGYLWNSGNFIALVSTLVAAFEDKAPTVLDNVRMSLAEGKATGDGVILGEAFSSAPKISFDYAIMEQFDDCRVVSSSMEWSDLGAWDAVHRARPKDNNGNSSSGDALLLGSTNNHVRVAPDRFAVLNAVDGLNVIVEDDVVLVSHLDFAQEVKGVVEELKNRGRSETDIPCPDFDPRQTYEEWVSWLNTAALPLWWCHGFDHENSLWLENLDPVYARSTGDDVRARVQGRQAYVYSRAGALGWKGPWRTAVQDGFSAIEQYYAGDGGLLRTLVSQNGQPIDETSVLYDQTFVLLALAQARNTVPEAGERALDLLTSIQDRFERRDGKPGFCEANENPYQSNAHMHLFEAALAWIEAGGDGCWKDLAQSIAELARDKFVDPARGVLREFFDTDWAPAAGHAGGIIEPGHQFEWAWLFARWARLSGHDEYLSLAERLFQVGVKGVDPARGVAIDRMSEEAKPTLLSARLWPQTEWLKAACILAATANSGNVSVYEDQIVRSSQALSRFLNFPIRGLWYDKMLPNGEFVSEPAPASSFYHIIGAIEALGTWKAD